ncbi:MAG: carboxypeptidase regulatory-like domain-containing protein, partial [Planctomycetota bacterium]
MSRSQSGNSQLIGLLVVLALVIGGGAFLFLGGDAEIVDPLNDQPQVEENQQEPIEAGNLDPAPVREPDQAGIGSRTELEELPGFGSNADGIGAVVSGVVVDESGKPVSEAIVSLSRKYSSGDLFGKPKESEKFDAETDSMGRFRFRRLPAGDEMSTWVVHGDYAPTQGPTFSSLAQETQELPPIVMKSGYTLAGRITDTNGQPIPGSVEINRQRSGFAAAPREEQRAEDLALGRLVQAQADEQGNFLIRNIAEGIWTLHASHEGYASAQIRPILFFENKHVDDVEVVLEQEHHIAGRAIDENDRPVANALVSVSRVQPRPILTGNTTTQEDGSFDVRGLAEGIYGLSVQAEGFTNGHAGRVQADTTTLVVVMQVKAGISGRLTGPTGAAVPKFSIEIMRTRSGTKQYGLTGSVYEFESADGTYEIASLDPGTYILLARAPGLAATYSASFRLDREDLQGIDIPMQAGGVLRGQVLDGTSNKPVAGVVVSLHGDEYNPAELDSLFGASLGDPNNIPRITATTDKQGNFTLDNAFPGTVQVLVTHQQYLSELVPTTVVDGSTQDLGAIHIYRGGSIFGIATGKDGSPMIGGTVNLSRKDGDAFFHKTSTVNTRGRFSFLGLKSGSYEIIAFPAADESVFLFPPEGDKKSVFVGDGQDVE